MKSRQISNIIHTSRTFNSRPSQLINIEDEYVAYCFDEACAYIFGQLEAGKIPHYTENRRENNALQKLVAGEL